MVILVDAMGGDNAPEAVVNGCVDAILENEGFEVCLIGDIPKIEKILKERNYSGERIKLAAAGDVITNEDVPTKAIRSKKQSSMVLGFNLLKEKRGDVFLSAGNTGAMVIGASLILGRIKGVDRPALAPIIPTKRGGMLLIDGGANTACRALNYLQFALMGSIYLKGMTGIQNPKVGLINVGTEEMKGNETIKQAYALLSSSEKINFRGNIEGQQVLEGVVNIAVCDGFAGNVLLKFYEGAGNLMLNELRNMYNTNLLTRLSALAVKRYLKRIVKKMEPSEYGGVPLLGVAGNVIKAHGSSNSKAIKNAVLQAYNYARSNTIQRLSEEILFMEANEVERTC